MNLDLDDTTRRRGADCLSDLSLDRLAQGELAGAARAAADAHLAACDACSARAERLGALQAEFTREVWVAADVARIRRALPAPRVPLGARLARILSAGGAFAAVAATFAFAMLLPPADSGTRAKGGDALTVFVRRADGRVSRALPGEPVAAGDALRFEVGTMRAGYVAVLGLDASPQAFLYEPASGAMPRVTAGRTLLDGSIILDAARGTERELAVVCNAPIDPEKVREAGQRALAAAGGDPARVTTLGLSGCRESTLLLTRASP